MEMTRSTHNQHKQLNSQKANKKKKKQALQLLVSKWNSSITCKNNTFAASYLNTQG
jgi:hypothetical protein